MCPKRSIAPRSVGVGMGETLVGAGVSSRSGSSDRLHISPFDRAVGVDGEASVVPGVDRAWAGPWPASELCSPVIVDRGAQFFGGVHHERAQLEYRGSDWLPLEEQEFRRTTFVRNEGGDIGVELDSCSWSYEGRSDVGFGTLEEVEHAIELRNRRWYLPSGPLGESDEPDCEMGIGSRRPGVRG